MSTTSLFLDNYSNKCIMVNKYSNSKKGKKGKEKGFLFHFTLKPLV